MEVSVIITIYNIERYLEKCLQSVIDLDDRIKEIICIDDGSTDGSYKIVEQYQQFDSRFKLVRKKNGGVSSARNCGIKEAKYDYIMFIDGDDFVLSDRLAELLDKLCVLGEVDAVWTGYERVDRNGMYSINTRFSVGVYDNQFINKKFIPSILGISYEKLYSWFKGEQLLNQNQEYSTVWRGLYSKKIIDKYTIYFNENVETGEDILFNWEYYTRVNSVYISNSNYYCYVWREGSLIQDNRKIKFFIAKKMLIEVRDLLSEELKKKGLPDYAGEYQGSLVLTKIQMALNLSKCHIRDYYKFYKLFKKYSSYSGIRNAYNGLSLYCAPLKYKIVLWMAKRNLDIFLFSGCFILNKLNVHIYPDE